MEFDKFLQVNELHFDILDSKKKIYSYELQCTMERARMLILLPFQFVFLRVIVRNLILEFMN